VKYRGGQLGCCVSVSVSVSGEIALGSGQRMKPQSNQPEQSWGRSRLRGGFFYLYSLCSISLNLVRAGSTDLDVFELRKTSSRLWRTEARKPTRQAAAVAGRSRGVITIQRRDAADWESTRSFVWSSKLRSVHGMLRCCIGFIH